MWVRITVALYKVWVWITVGLCMGLCALGRWK
jgi:hypothetical protein